MKLQTSSERLDKLPPYLFAELDRKKSELIAKGIDVVDLGIGDPDIDPPKKMLDVLKEAVSEPAFHRYPSYKGAHFFREAAAKWLKSSHSVTADFETEILTLIGSKEGLAHLPAAIINPGDKVLVTDPCYPVHLQSVLLAGGEPVLIPLTEENGFLPDLKSVPEKTWRGIKLAVINYPNNPTSATAPAEFFAELIELAHKYNFIICHDAAYIDVSLDGARQVALMSLPGAKDVAIEFFSLSKLFNITGWRIGFCAGNREIVASLGKYKTAVDSGQFTAIQKAAAFGLNECTNETKKTLAIYSDRKQIFCSALKEIGLRHFESGATFYIWCRVPGRFSSQKFAKCLLEKCRIVATPGIGFGRAGDGYVRFSLTSPTERIKEASKRISQLEIF